jgi:ubiquinone/menaquinone biosynthesis C-methylase UbiE
VSAIHPDVRRVAFDGIASSYDCTFTYSRIGQAQREPMWRAMRKAFQPGDRVLDLGCGTGVDACFLAERGVHVRAVDCSSEMIRVAEQRVACVGKQDSVELQVLAIEQLEQLRGRGPFDGVVSNFGALNCVEDMRSVAKAMAELLRPGATALLCFLGPNCLWEVCWHLAHGNPKKALRRWKKASVARLADGSTLQVQYPSVKSLVNDFAPEFQLKSWKGIGITVPPSYVESWAGRFPYAMHFATRLDLVFSGCPGIRGLADHVSLEFVRNSL